MNHDLATAQAIAALSKTPFTYGVCDCCAFAAEVVRRVYGINFMEGWYYSTKREAMVIVINFGGLEGLMRNILGDPVPATHLQSGEPLLGVSDTDVATMGVRFQDRAVFKTQNGVTSLPITDERILKGWRVSCHKQSGS